MAPFHLVHFVYTHKRRSLGRASWQLRLAHHRLPSRPQQRRGRVLMAVAPARVQIVHGKNDTRTEVPISEQFYEDSVAQDKTLLKPDAHHQLFQDRPEVAEQAMQDISSWILERVPP